MVLDKLLQLLKYNSQEPLIFSSGFFLIMFLLFTFVYMLLSRKLTARLLFVTLFSYYFYYKSSGIYFFLLAIVTVSDYYIAKAIHSNLNNKGKARLFMMLSLMIDLGMLAYFKYTNFFAGMLAQAFHHNFQPYDIFLPVGISFFTFQSLSYTIDVYRGKLKPLPELLDYAFFVSFFPQLVAGPIVRACDFVPQIRRPINITKEMFAKGVWFIATGLSKKAIVSDYISVNFVDRVFDNPSLFSGGETLLALYGYGVQIYCDFSGYSDMAIGIALLLGFHFPLNFNAPFKADSMTDFWRRWHISLSSWIRDYVYISFGGNRKGAIRTYINQIAAMTLCGLWHGANLNFVIWGGVHGLLVCIHKFFSHRVMHHDRHYHPCGWRRVISVFLTFQLISLTWLFFRNQELSLTQVMVENMLFRFSPELLPGVIVAYRYVFVLIALALMFHFMPQSWNLRAIRFIERIGVVGSALLLVTIIYVVIQIKTSSVQPFIYFQF